MGKYQEGRILTERGDFAAAKEMFEVGMKEGDPKCAYGAMVTALHLGGDLERTEQLLRRVIPLLEILARRSDDEACFILGRCNEKGAAMPQNMPAAFAYYAQAASLGNADAMFNLGCLYMEQGAVQEALDHFKRSAALNCPDAKRALEHYHALNKKEEG